MLNKKIDFKQAAKQEFAKRLKRSLKANKLENSTYKELGEFFGTTDMAVHNWLNAKSIPAMTRLPHIAQKLGVSIDYLIKTNTQNLGEPHINKEHQLLTAYRNLSKNQQNLILALVDELQ